MTRIDTPSFFFLLRPKRRFLKTHTICIPAVRIDGCTGVCVCTRVHRHLTRLPSKRIYWACSHLTLHFFFVVSTSVSLQYPSSSLQCIQRRFHNTEITFGGHACRSGISYACSGRVCLLLLLSLWCIIKIIQLKTVRFLSFSLFLFFSSFFSLPLNCKK